MILIHILKSFIILHLRSGPMIIWPSYGPWNLKFCKIFSFRHFISLWFEILTWFLIRVYNHKLQINFEICSGWMIFGQLTAVGLWNLAKYLVVTIFCSLWFEILTIQPEQISKLICNLWLYTLVPKIKSISKFIVK
jgi:hypothetical protein